MSKELTAGLKRALRESARGHRRLCPRQVLGVRIGLLGGELLGLRFPRRDKRVLVFMETDGCASDGVAAASGCRVGRRTMRIVDYGKVAATFVDTLTAQAFRVWPSPAARALASQHAPDEPSRWHAQLAAYQHIPASRLLLWEPVVLTDDLDAILSRPGVRATCAHCGEEVMNDRQARVGALALCRACAGPAYYRRTLPPDAGRPPIAPDLAVSPDLFAEPQTLLAS